ncbi:hypothetical protein V6R21_20110 [Limibacter armeniacum]|uniref:hypothetical protein n=1 Tax=Limibacter armeniacum TaxID=466084 RepID=UPI002FE518F0
MAGTAKIDWVTVAVTFFSSLLVVVVPAFTWGVNLSERMAVAENQIKNQIELITKVADDWDKSVTALEKAIDRKVDEQLVRQELAEMKADIGELKQLLRRYNQMITSRKSKQTNFSKCNGTSAIMAVSQRDYSRSFVRGTRTDIKPVLQFVAEEQGAETTGKLLGRRRQPYVWPVGSIQEPP